MTIPSIRKKYISKNNTIKKLKKPASSLDKILFFSELTELNSKIVNAKTKAMLAMLDPRALPIAILLLPSRLDSIEINISGDEVAIPIKMKLDINPDILYFLEILSVDDTSRFAP